MRPLRKVIRVLVNGESFGDFPTFKSAYRALMAEKFEFKGYHNEVKKFRRVDFVKYIALKRGQYFYTVQLEKVVLNDIRMNLRPINYN